MSARGGKIATPTGSGRDSTDKGESSLGPVTLVTGVSFFPLASATPDGRLVQLLALQNARVARRQLLVAGLSSRMIETRLARGTLVAVHSGVYGAAPLVPAPLADETAALLACGPRAHLCATTAAALWELIPAPPEDGPIEIVLLGGGSRGRTRDGVALHRSVALTRKDVTRHEGLPIVTAAWAMLEIAAQLDRRATERALDEGLARRRFTHRTMLAVLGRARAPRAATDTLRDLLKRRRRLTITQSEKEEKVLPLIRQAGIPDPVCQARLHGYSVDFYWPEVRFGLEVDSMWHATNTNMRRDRRKDAALRDRGIELARAMWEDLDDRPLEVVAHLVRQIERRALRAA
jgi:very-short-patch-repair endonuclease